MLTSVYLKTQLAEKRAPLLFGNFFLGRGLETSSKDLRWHRPVLLRDRGRQTDRQGLGMCYVLKGFTSTMIRDFSLQQKARLVCPQQNFTTGDLEAAVWVGAEGRSVLGLAICDSVEQLPFRPKDCVFRTFKSLLQLYEIFVKISLAEMIFIYNFMENCFS